MARHAAARRADYIAKDAGGAAENSASKAAFEALQKGFDAFKSENNAALDEIKKNAGKLDPVTEEKLNKASADVGNLQKQLDDIVKQLKRPNMGGDAEAEKKQKATAYRKAFGQFFRKGEHKLDGDQEKMLEERKSLSVGTDADGGYTAPAELDHELANVLKEVSPMRSLARVIQVGASSYEKVRNLRGTASGWVGETAARAETDGPALDKITIPTGEIYANPGATQAILDDSFLNIEQWLSDEVALEFAAQEGAAFVSGNGTNKPKGFLAETMAANGSQTASQIGYVATGVAGDWAASDPSDTLITLIYGLKAGYRINAKWIANGTTIASIRKFKDGQGNYLWQPSAQAGQPATLMGYEIVDVPDMPAIAANSYSVAFGDFQRGYLITDRIGVRVLRDPFTNKPYVMFYTTKRVGGRVVMHEAIKVLKFAAS